MSSEQRNSGGSAFLSLSDRKQSDEVVRKLLDAAPDAVIVVDEQGRIVFANLQVKQLFGYDKSELVGSAVETLIPERYRAGHVGHRSKFVAAPKVRTMGSGLELQGRRRDGSEFPIEISLSPLPTDQGLLTSASIRDVSERKLNEAKIRRIQGHLLSAVESIQGAFAIYDAEDRLVLCNSACRQILGQKVNGEIVGRTFAELLDANLAAGAFNLGSQTVDEFRTLYSAYHRNPTGVIDVRSSEGASLRIVERRTAEGGVVTTIWDVTDDVRNEEELRHARAAAEAASSAKSEFLASMSHELRTPLNAILGFAQLLQRDKKEPLSTRHQERIAHVLKAGEHLLHLIDDVLDLSRIEAGQVIVSPEPVSVTEVLSEVTTVLAPMAARAEIAITIVPVPSDLPAVTADRTRFKQILMNFGSNAVKYGKPSGRVLIQAHTTDGFVRITVTDNGIGIPADKQDKIFQPFQRAGQETGAIEGTGIGLAITKRLAELMGGRVGFRSTAGQGSEFWIDLQVRRRQSDAPLPTKAVLSEGSVLTGSVGSRHLVVYVEDNPSNIAFMEDLIADFERVDLLVAPTAEIGIELVRVRKPNVVIMDINLPGMSGFEATRRLREWPETAHIPVVALSAAAMVRDKSKITEAGFYRYLTKPVKVDELAEVLEALFSQGS